MGDELSSDHNARGTHPWKVRNPNVHGRKLFTLSSRRSRSNVFADALGRDMSRPLFTAISSPANVEKVEGERHG